MMIGILGFAGAGKDTVFELLEKHDFQRIAMADPVKRVCQEVFQFTYNQLWGTQLEKETPDPRYPRAEHLFGDRWGWDEQAKIGYRQCACCGLRSTKIDGELADLPQCRLTPRFAMQRMGTEGGRASWDDIWVSRAIGDARLVLEGHLYDRVLGVNKDRKATPPRGVIFTDCRFISEVDAILKAGGKIYRLRRPGFDRPPFDHSSETEQLRISDDRLDGVIMNDGTLADLEEKVLRLLGLS